MHYMNFNKLCSLLYPSPPHSPTPYQPLVRAPKLISARSVKRFIIYELRVRFA